VSELEYKVIIGLEIHVQLNTASKMFCRCPNRFGDEPNSNVCPICMGSPGVLPVMNRQAFEFGVRTALALNCQIAEFTKWDRKSYYYPDLPKNYQISQYDLPLAQNGHLEIPVNGELKKIRIRRLHLEEDAGKLLHEGSDAHTRLDLNRAGTALMEIVTEPDLNSPAEAHTFGTELRTLVRHLEVSEANMEQGQMRLEPNINLIIQRGEKEHATPIVEVKNLGSLRALERATAYEVERQLAQWQETGITMEMGNKSTRGWDEVRGVTVLQREKEEAHDYRYFPEPDLVPVTVDPHWRDQVRKDLPELPVLRRMRFRDQYGFSETDAVTIVEDRPTADLFERAVELGGPAKVLCNHFINFWSRHANQRGCSIGALGIDAERMAQLAKMVDENVITPTAAPTVAEHMLTCNDEPRTIAQRENLLQVSDGSALEVLVDEVIETNPKAIADATKPGKKQKKAFGFLLGQVMQKSRGQANPKVVNELLQKKLSASRD